MASRRSAMPSVFESLPPAERRAQQAAYLEFLKERDGKPDRAKRTLAQREAWFGKLDAAPVQWDGTAPREEFALLTGPDAAAAAVRGASALALWMAIVA